MTPQEEVQYWLDVKEGRLPWPEWAKEMLVKEPRAAVVSESITIHPVPSVMATVLREFARREGVELSELLKRWLHERILDEREKLREKLQTKV